MSISDMLWDLARDLDSATQTYLVPDLSGLLKLKTITDLTKAELNFIIYCPSITIHQLSTLRRNSRHPDARKARRIFRELKQLIRSRNQKIKLQTDIEESHVEAKSHGPQSPADRVIHAALFLRQSGKAVKIISNNQSFKDKARSSGLDILHHQHDLEVSDEPVEVQQPILEETPMTDLELRQRIEQLWIELDFTGEPEATPGQLVNESLDVAVKFARASGTKRKMVKTILSDEYSFGQPASRRSRHEVHQNM